MKKLLSEIRACTICEEHLPAGCRPVLAASKTSRLIVIGQAPGRKVHASGIPWDDASGKRLREWMGIDKEQFYDAKNVAIIPMGFCYPGTGKSGDLPPRKECAPQWHEQLFEQLPSDQLIMLIGAYAQKYYLKETAEKNLTETVRHFENYLPRFLVLPHPSPRNNRWIRNNPWFEQSLVPQLQQHVARRLNG